MILWIMQRREEVKMHGIRFHQYEQSTIIQSQIGLSSINDTFILLSLKSRLLREYISSETTLASILRLFEDIKLRTEIGQMLDLNTVNQQTKELNYQYK